MKQSNGSPEKNKTRSYRGRDEASADQVEVQEEVAFNDEKRMRRKKRR